MDIRPLRETELRRFVEELWLPFQRELASKTGTYELATDVDLVATETEHRRERFADDDQRAWVAVDSTQTGPNDSEFVGFLTAETTPSPPVFERPDRVMVNDLFVHESHRGSGLADELLGRAAAWATERDADQLSLDVHIDNDRARAFYAKHGFEALRQRLVADADEI
ncbi:MAG: N-acetyltransferase family protein [Halopenitus sp.]